MKAIAMLFSLALTALAQTIPADPDDIGGVVTSAKGPEAGVWVIAETTDLPTKFAKIVVTDDRGRYLVPDLPKANYSIWVRGYGLVDSAKVQSAAGQDAEPESRPSRPTPAPPRNTIRRATGIRCSRSPTRANFPAPGRKATASRPTSRARPNGSS